MIQALFVPPFILGCFHPYSLLSFRREFSAGIYVLRFLPSFVVGEGPSRAAHGVPDVIGRLHGNGDGEHFGLACR